MYLEIFRLCPEFQMPLWYLFEDRQQRSVCQVCCLSARRESTYTLTGLHFNLCRLGVCRFTLSFHFFSYSTSHPGSAVIHSLKPHNFQCRGVIHPGKWQTRPAVWPVCRLCAEPSLLWIARIQLNLHRVSIGPRSREWSSCSLLQLIHVSIEQSHYWTRRGVVLSIQPFIHG